MVEIKIPTNLLADLLSERMDAELQMRTKVSMTDFDCEMESLSYKQLIGIIETAVYDIVMMLPAHLITQENNLDDILVRAVKSLPISFYRRELQFYTSDSMNRLLKPLREMVQSVERDKKYLEN